ncbi:MULTISPECIES: class I SAM-dependent methyltransferase [unclassified Dinoroseobacter]|uniref:class I SAM-dependent methyltransferase n=1 Tax=unclassified Dinoroseobacter TaxID=2620028 RepID=UPI003C798AE8
MTPLAELLIARIAATGPITVAEYMAECLLHPAHGYYTTRPPFGREGDFTTAPEISQMFGEMLGLALAQAWMDQGAPAEACLAEIGPGRGTLMADILRVFGQIPGGPRLHPHLVEASPALRRVQAEAVPGAQWHDTVADLPEAPLFLVGNEFFDALPIRQFQRTEEGWAERMVGVSDGALSLGLGPSDPRPELDHRRGDTTPGDLVETCAPARPIMTEIARRIATHGGAAYLIDYGGWHSLGDTLQAVRAHAPDPVLAHPGEADLTAHVDFEPLAQAAAEAGAHPAPLTPQGVFLEQLGITARAQALATRLSGAALDSHIAAHRRLTHPDEMGTLFKVLGVSPKDAPPLAGMRP